MKKILILLLMFITTLLSAQPVDVKTYIPPQAFKYFPDIKSESKKYFPE
jgi:hypothetical protein